VGISYTNQETARKDKVDHDGGRKIGRTNNFVFQQYKSSNYSITFIVSYRLAYWAA